MQIADNINLIMGKINVYFDYGSIEAHCQNYEKAKQYWELSLEMSIAINYQKGISLAQYALSQIPK